MRRDLKFSDESVAVHLHGESAGEWAGHYHVSTTGRSDVEIVAEVNRLHAHHEKKSARLTSFHSEIVGSTFRIGPSTFTFTDCTIRERGTAVEVYVAVDHRPFPTYHATVDDIPSNAEIVSRVTEIIAAEQTKKAAHADKIASVKALLGV